uniref:Uncharacterized protein n=1 Tax=viral metagenome TaxID=1070528 RepID=A0A6H2A0W9_9ZZZZ
MEMKDMGKMREQPTAVEAPEGKKEKVYSSFNLSSKELPELKGKKFGDNIELHIVGEVGGIHEDYDDKKEASYDIKVMKCGIIGKIDRDEYLSMSEEEKDKHDEEEVLKEEKKEEKEE